MFRSRPMTEPGSQASVDLGVTLVGMASPQILAHHVDPVVVKGQSRAEPLGNSLASGVSVVHDLNCTAYRDVSDTRRRRPESRSRCTDEGGSEDGVKDGGLTVRAGPG